MLCVITHLPLELLRLKDKQASEGGRGKIHFNTLSSGDARNLLDFVTGTSDMKYIATMKSEGGVCERVRLWGLQKKKKKK